MAEGGNTLGGDEEGRYLQFLCGGNDEFYDLGKSEEWAVVDWDGNVFRKKDVATYPAAGLDFIKEGRVGLT